MDKPYRAIAKLIRTIESCETIGQLNVATQMWENINYKIDNYFMINLIYNKKLKELKEKENADSE